MNFQYQYFEKEFEKSKKELKKAWKQGNIYKTLCYLRYLTCFYYTINYTLSDEELEEITQDISFKLLGETRIERTDDNTVIFYDGFGLATRGLAIRKRKQCSIHKSGRRKYSGTNEKTARDRAGYLTEIYFYIYITRRCDRDRSLFDCKR